MRVPRNRPVKLINGEIAKNKGSYFGLYLYYTYRFQNHTFNTVEEIDEARNFIGSFDEASRRSGIICKNAKKVWINLLGVLPVALLLL